MNKINVNPVGANCVRPHFKEIAKYSKGITLIALIITIIVMMILVGVTVNVALNGGLFDIAKQAVSGMNMAQIEERAIMVKYMLIADAESDANIIASKAEYKAKLLEEFNVEETITYGSNIIEVNDKYVIIIKNSDLDIEVAEKTKIPANYLLISMGYETNNIEQNGKVYGTNVEINVERLLDINQYSALVKEQGLQNQAPEETKKQAFLQYFNDWFYPDEPFTNIDKIVVYDVNLTYGTEYTSIEECLQDEIVQGDMGTTKEALYYYLYTMCLGDPGVENTEITEQEAIDTYYQIEELYYKNIAGISLHVAINGLEQEEPLSQIRFASNLNQITVNYAIGQNGTYEFILKTRNGEEIAREILRVSNITTEDNPYYVTGEDAQSVWTTDGAGTITGYTGTDANIYIPLKIGEESITKIGNNVFEGNENLISVSMMDNITNIGSYVFYRCSNLGNIKLSNSLSTIGSGAFEKCESLTKIVFPESLASIGSWAFMNCDGLKEITIPKSVENLESQVFSGCDGLLNATILSPHIEIKYGLFEACRNLTNVSLQKGIRTIGNSAFIGCRNLKDITLSEGLTSIEYAFSGCASLTNITIPNSVTSMSSATFENCSNLTTINFAPGDNDIPEGQPWGAPNENVQVIKLEENQEPGT